MTAAREELPTEPGRCPQCGTALPAGTTAADCPRCLLKAGLLPPPVQTQPTVRVGSLARPPQELLGPGQEFGHYRIARTLGGGGMGTAFEAEDLESGRRVALKVLSHALDSPEARERFFREGRLAASINHPNSVYVFGTEEIAGTPVISMELVPGGTLQDRVETQGPMPAAEAVDAVLQIIAGLEAAQRVGILHRDVKPSNCFIDPDGTVKVGDFGLSISTAIRTEPSLTATGMFLGTPAFCAPEQLRGDELNARADMYSVGATLFYLLTGRTPFEAKNVVALISTVMEQPAPSPRKWVPHLPQGLAKVVRRCLEKAPSERFRNYAELRQALEPYGTAAPVPATLGLRFVAGVVDLLVLNVFILGLMMLMLGDPMQFLDLSASRSPLAMGFVLGAFIASMLYYGLMEGLRGATIGKALCRLRVVGPTPGAPGVPRALLRAVLYVVLPVAPFWLVFGMDTRAFLDAPGVVQQGMSFSFYIILALLFSTVRRRNGMAAVQDLVTRTRVITRATAASRPAVQVLDSAPASLEGTRQIGPYHVLETLEAGHWLLGYDLRLLRKVWIRLLTAGTPPVPVHLRNLARVTRLRWLTGKRSAEENWDAYEAPSGRALPALATEPQRWSQVRFWIYDLATEIQHAEAEQSLPELDLDRVWITGDGRAKLLDFAAPGCVENAGGARAQAEGAGSRQPAGCGAGVFLSHVATAALGGKRTNERGVAGSFLPLHAQEFLKNLASFVNAEAIVPVLKPLLRRVTEVTRLRRAAVVGGCVVFPLIAGLATVAGTRMLVQFAENHPGVLELNTLLEGRWAMKTFSKQPVPTDEQYGVYIASHFGSLITNQAKWTSPLALALVKGDARRFAERSVAEHPAPRAEEIADAEAALKPFVPPQDLLTFQQMPPHMPFIVAHSTLIFYVGFPALIAALFFRGGLVLRLAGVALVGRDGTRAARWRVFWRALVAWVPVVASIGLYLSPKPSPLSALQWAGLAGLGVLVVISLALPRRSLPDRLAGTWMVPR